MAEIERLFHRLYESKKTTCLLSVVFEFKILLTAIDANIARCKLIWTRAKITVGS